MLKGLTQESEGTSVGTGSPWLVEWVKCIGEGPEYRPCCDL
jgi:hypothetical protein